MKHIERRDKASVAKLKFRSILKASSAKLALNPAFCVLSSPAHTSGVPHVSFEAAPPPKKFSSSLAKVSSSTALKASVSTLHRSSSLAAVPIKSSISGVLNLRPGSSHMPKESFPLGPIAEHLHENNARYPIPEYSRIEAKELILPQLNVVNDKIPLPFSDCSFWQTKTRLLVLDDFKTHKEGDIITAPAVPFVSASQIFAAIQRRDYSLAKAMLQIYRVFCNQFKSVAKSILDKKCDHLEGIISFSFADLQQLPPMPSYNSGVVSTLVSVFHQKLATYSKPVEEVGIPSPVSLKGDSTTAFIFDSSLSLPEKVKFQMNDVSYGPRKAEPPSSFLKTSVVASEPPIRELQEKAPEKATTVFLTNNTKKPKPKKAVANQLPDKRKISCSKTAPDVHKAENSNRSNGKHKAVPNNPFLSTSKKRKERTPSKLSKGANHCLVHESLESDIFEFKI